MKQVYYEKQRFAQWWIWLLLAAVALYPIYQLYVAYFECISLIESIEGRGWLVVEVLILLAIVVFIATIRLTTTIDNDNITIRFFPLVKRNVCWEEVAKAEVLDYGFVGGWGLRIGTRYGVVYNTSGRKGLAITLKNGKRFLVGTQREEELRSFIKTVAPEGVVNE